MFGSKSKIKRHFNSLAPPYASGSINRVWKFIRKREKEIFCELICGLKREMCLDFGAGSCEYAKILLDKGARLVTCVDFSDSLTSQCRETRIEKVICDVEVFNTGRKYDLVLCLGVLEFLDRPKEFMMNLKKFLKPDGRVIVLLPQSGVWSFGYAFYYLTKGIFIHPLSLRRFNNFLVSRGFQLEQKITQNLFSGFTVYSVDGDKR